MKETVHYEYYGRPEVNIKIHRMSTFIACHKRVSYYLEINSPFGYICANAEYS